MIIRGSKLIGGAVVFDLETGVAQNLTDDGTLETNEEITSLSSQSSGFVNSPTNPDSSFNPANFVEAGNDDEPVDSLTSGNLSPQSITDWEPGGSSHSNGDGDGSSGGGTSDGNTNSGHQSTNTTGPDGVDYFNPEDEVEVPLVLGQNEPERRIKGQTWLTFDENGQGVISVYNGQEWSKVGEELQPLDIGSY